LPISYFCAFWSIEFTFLDKIDGSVLTKSQAKATEFNGALHNGQGNGAGAILTSQ